MRQRIDLRNTQLGCWTILSCAPNITDGSGVTRTRWNVMCNNCFYVFTQSTKYIRGRRRKPNNCPYCKKGKKLS